MQNNDLMAEKASLARPEESSKVMHNALYKGNGSREFPLCQLRI